MLKVDQFINIIILQHQYNAKVAKQSETHNDSLNY